MDKISTILVMGPEGLALVDGLVTYQCYYSYETIEVLFNSVLDVNL